MADAPERIRSVDSDAAQVRAELRALRGEVRDILVTTSAFGYLVPEPCV